MYVKGKNSCCFSSVWGPQRLTPFCCFQGNLSLLQRHPRPRGPSGQLQLRHREVSQRFSFTPPSCDHPHLTGPSQPAASSSERGELARHCGQSRRGWEPRCASQPCSGPSCHQEGMKGARGAHPCWCSPPPPAVRRHEDMALDTNQKAASCPGPRPRPTLARLGLLTSAAAVRPHEAQRNVCVRGLHRKRSDRMCV